jgi:hypothetical protein
MKLIMENWKKFLNEEPIEEWTKEQVQAILAGDDPGPEKSEMFASPPEAPQAPACDPEEDAIDVRILDAAAAALEGSDLADQIDCLKKQIVRAFEGDDEDEDYGGEREKNIAGVFGQIERLVREALSKEITKDPLSRALDDIRLQRAAKKAAGERGKRGEPITTAGTGNLDRFDPSAPDEEKTLEMTEKEYEEWRDRGLFKGSFKGAG